MTTTPTRPPSARSKARPSVDPRIRARRDAVHRAGMRRRRRRLASTAAVLAAVIAAVVIGRSPLFAITDVRVEELRGDQEIDSGLVTQVLAAARVQVGQNMFEANLAAARERVEALPWISDAAIDQVPPSAVVIRIEQRPVAAVVRTRDASWLVGASGMLIAGGERETAPVIAAPDADMPPLGEPVEDTGVRAALSVIAGLPPVIADQVRRYEPVEEGVTAVMDTTDALPEQNELRVRLGSPRDLQQKATVIPAMIEAIAERQQQQEKPVKVELDVRAPEHPVLRPF